jgi:hypothetical protein
MRYNKNDLLKYIEPDEIDPDVLSLAKELALYYKSLCKANTSWLKPFNESLPIEHQKCFQHFVKTAELVHEIQRYGETVSARDFIMAQFEGLSFTGRVPYMTQLHTPTATIRYKEFVSKRLARGYKVVKSEDVQSDVDFLSEQRKAEKMAERLGVSTKRAIRMMSREFSESFLRHHGVWEEAKSDYQQE